MYYSIDQMGCAAYETYLIKKRQCAYVSIVAQFWSV